ncbi:MAG: M16 family metallopeptidase [Thermoanaerobaculia bacterium]
MGKLRVLAASAALSAAALPLSAAGFRVPIEQFTLGNGLRVALSPDHASPVIAVAVYYHVGSRDEEKGRSGFAHLFEHMMFQGSAHVKKGEIYSLVENNGGILNGSTHPEYTDYFEMMPSDRLELALWLEADRMRSLAVNAENLKNQQEVVKEEKRLRVDNQPYVPSFLEMDEMLFRNWANAHSVIGSMEDLDAANLEDVKAFFRTHYAPNNAVLVIAGDFDPKEARGWVEKHFASIPGQKAPDRPSLAEPDAVARTEKTTVDKLAKVPAVLIGWKVPGKLDRSSAAIDLLSDLLGDGEASLLYQSLVKQQQIAVSARAGYDESAGPSTFTVLVVERPGADAKKSVAAVEALVRRIQDKGATDEELARARALYKSERFSTGFQSLQTPLGRAEAIGWAALFDPDGAEGVNSEVARYDAVTAADLRDAARKYLIPERRSVIEIEPPAKAPASGGGR